ncbi:MAG: hypothetical protein K0S56_3824 [Microvirga sp.]|jgi:hypothetical protein|nr:hypothetical protein [Microvirga sp.]
MLKRHVDLTLEEELQVLGFWAHGMDIFTQFSPEKIASIRGLSEAIEAARKLPAAIGWDYGEPRVMSNRPGRKEASGSGPR